MTVKQLTLDEYLQRIDAKPSKRAIGRPSGKKDRTPRPHRQNYDSIFPIIIEVANEVMRDLQSDRFYPSHLMARGVPYCEFSIRKILKMMAERGIVRRVGERRGWVLA